MTAYLPVVRREGSISALRAAAVRRLRSETRLRAQRPLLAALRPTATIPPASLSYKCARAARTPYLLFIIYYLLFAPPGHSRPRWCTCPQCLGKSQ